MFSYVGATVPASHGRPRPGPSFGLMGPHGGFAVRGNEMGSLGCSGHSGPAATHPLSPLRQCMIADIKLTGLRQSTHAIYVNVARRLAVLSSLARPAQRGGGLCLSSRHCGSAVLLAGLQGKLLRQSIPLPQQGRRLRAAGGELWGSSRSARASPRAITTSQRTTRLRSCCASSRR